MDLDRLMEDLEHDEGVKYQVYLDHLGLPTFGIGHLITENDPEYGAPVGTPVDAARVEECFENDIQTVLRDCKRVFPDFHELPSDAQLVICNMLFNLGLTRFLGFKNFIAAVDARDWAGAADQMVDSRWYRQVPKRANRLVERIRALA